MFREEKKGGREEEPRSGRPGRATRGAEAGQQAGEAQPPAPGPGSRPLNPLYPLGAARPGPAVPAALSAAPGVSAPSPRLGRGLNMAEEPRSQPLGAAAGPPPSRTHRPTSVASVPSRPVPSRPVPSLSRPSRPGPVPPPPHAPPPRPAAIFLPPPAPGAVHARYVKTHGGARGRGDCACAALPDVPEAGHPALGLLPRAGAGAKRRARAHCGGGGAPGAQPWPGPRSAPCQQRRRRHLPSSLPSPRLPPGPERFFFSFQATVY